MIEFNLCQNDRVGNKTHAVRKIDLVVGSEVALELEPKGHVWNESVELKSSDYRFFFDNARVKFNKETDWAGNIFWQGYQFTDAYGLGFLYLLQQSGKWYVSSGWSNLYEKFEKGEEITAEDLELPKEVKKCYINTAQESLKL